ncbi:MAG: VWA domain-containing protein [Gemmatimonadota bacterium]
MAEPEDVLAEGALLVTHTVRQLWLRASPAGLDPQPRLIDLKRRLELFLAAVFAAAPEIATAEPPAPRSFLARLAHRRTAHLDSPHAIASTDGVGIRLPAALEGIPRAEIADRYRLLALEQATRIDRGTLRCLTDDRLTRDFYLLAEAAAIDASLVALFPRLRPAIVAARREAAMSRPVVRHPSALDLTLEQMLLDLLEADPAVPPLAIPNLATPELSRQWAQLQRARLDGPYTGLAPVPLWGTIAMVEAATATPGPGQEGMPSAPGRTRTLPRRPRVREAAADEDDAESGTWMVRADDLQEKAEDPAGLQRPSDRDQQADAGALADMLSELPELRLVRVPGAVREVLLSEDPIPRRPGPAAETVSAGLAYPEWDWKSGSYRPRAAVVHEIAADTRDDGWVEAMLRRQAAMLGVVRRDFERLRPRRAALNRQSEGTELDLDAIVVGLADRRAGGVPDDRCYIDARPGRRDLAIAILVDASASTDGWVTGDRRIIDVEKEALLVVTEAITALGDPCAILAFAGEGPGRVEVKVIKRFDGRETAGVIRRRIGGLEPGGFTRAGAAIRHATAGLARQTARHRLLLLLSDGRPNDVDHYEGRYGIEDTRVAVAEARLQGLSCFCLTVDREAPRYAARIFGREYAVLTRAERLPLALTAVLRDLVRR